MNTFNTKRAPSNPLNPKYKLASFEPLEPEIPKFIRDSINIDVPSILNSKDIKGARPRTFHKKIENVKDLLDNTDIDGSRPKKEYIVSFILKSEKSDHQPP